MQRYNLGWYISNIKQLRIAALQSWLIYFKYQTTKNCSITILVDIFQISNNSELHHYNLGWYISNIKQVRIAALQSWLIYFKYQRTQNCSMTMLVVSNTCDALRDLISFMQFKKRKKHPWRIVTFSKNAGFSLQPYCSNGTNSHKASHICFV